MTGRPLNILSIQSHVVYGHVGNSAAVFPMQRLGCEVWPVHTVQFSNHPGYGAFAGEVFGAGLIDACVEGIAARGALARCDGLLSGYMGAPATGEAILRAAARLATARPGAVYCCDPVIGDAGRGVYVREGLPDFIRDRALPAATIVTPNQFELDRLAGFPARSLDELRRSLAALHAKGPRVVLVTSVATDATPADAIDLIASQDGRLWRVRTPRLEQTFNGAGDALAALFLVHWLRTGSAADALAESAASLFGLLRRTAEAGEREIALVAAQEEIVAPTTRFRPEPIDPPVPRQ
jgi:pyridoxine kinase